MRCPESFTPVEYRPGRGDVQVVPEVAAGAAPPALARSPRGNKKTEVESQRSSAVRPEAVAAGAPAGENSSGCRPVPRAGGAGFASELSARAPGRTSEAWESGRKSLPVDESPLVVAPHPVRGSDQGSPSTSQVNDAPAPVSS